MMHRAELKKLTREKIVYRDVVNVAVGEDAQSDIDKHLAISDILIFIQTKEVVNSNYIMKELCYVIVNNIPVLWIHQIRYHHTRGQMIRSKIVWCG